MESLTTPAPASHGPMGGGLGREALEKQLEAELDCLSECDDDDFDYQQDNAFVREEQDVEGLQYKDANHGTDLRDPLWDEYMQSKQSQEQHYSTIMDHGNLTLETDDPETTAFNPIQYNQPVVLSSLTYLEVISSHMQPQMGISSDIDGLVADTGPSAADILGNSRPQFDDGEEIRTLMKEIVDAVERIAPLYKPPTSTWDPEGKRGEKDGGQGPLKIEIPSEFIEKNEEHELLNIIPMIRDDFINHEFLYNRVPQAVRLLEKAARHEKDNDETTAEKVNEVNNPSAVKETSTASVFSTDAHAQSDLEDDIRLRIEEDARLRQKRRERRQAEVERARKRYAATRIQACARRRQARNSYAAIRREHEKLREEEEKRKADEVAAYIQAQQRREAEERASAARAAAEAEERERRLALEKQLAAAEMIVCDRERMMMTNADAESRLHMAFDRTPSPDIEEYGLGYDSDGDYYEDYHATSAESRMVAVSKIAFAGTLSPQRSLLNSESLQFLHKIVPIRDSLSSSQQEEKAFEMLSSVPTKNCEDDLRKAVLESTEVARQKVFLVCGSKGADTCSEESTRASTMEHVCDPLSQAYSSWVSWISSQENSGIISRRRTRGSQCDHRIDGGANHADTQMMRAGYDVDWEEDTLLSLGLLGSHYASFQSLEINVEGITSATFLRHFNNLIKLEMNVNKLQDVHGLGALGSLEELSIKDNILVSIDGIESLHSLKSLRLDSNKLCDLSPLNGLSSLTSLSANNNLLEIMPSLDIPALQRLELYQNNLVMIPTESMQGLPSLMHLDIGRNKLEYIDGNALTQCLNLSTLILSQNSLHAVPAPLYLPHLRNLWLSGNKISDLSMWAPRLQPQGMFTCNSEFEKAFGNAKSFKEIYDHRQHLHWPVFLPMLEKLRLQDNQIQCVDCGSLSGMPSLRELDVSFNALQTVNSLHGLVGLGGESLKILHLQDNPISKDVVTNQHNVNVQDEHERVESLREFLQFACPALTTMSGKPFQFEGVGEDSYEGSGVQGLIAQERSSNTSTADRHRDAASILAAYRRTGTWASVALAASHMYNGNALPSKIVCDTHKFKLRMSQAVDKHTSEDDSEIFQGLRRCEHAFLCDRSEHVKTMMKLIATFSTEQNALRLREKHYRGSIDGCKVADGSNDPSSVEAKRKKYWASAIVHFLEDQHDQLRAFARTKATNTSEIQKQDHVDEDDHVPNRLYSTLQLTEEMHFQDDDSINHQGPTSIGIAGDMQCLHQAHEDLHTSEVGSSMAHSASAYDIVGAATRLQRVYRGSRVRKQLKLALASAKYVDDELEDIMNDDDMDELNEFLNMNFSLDAEISDFQGDGCAAGKGAIEPGAADLRTYSESRDDDRSERSDRTSISRTPSIVYGDHRRKRKESREALPSVGITAHREVSLDRVRTSTADTDADSVRSELLSEASAHGTRDAKRFSSHDHAPLNNAWDSPTLKPQPPSMQQPNRKRTNPFHLGTMLAQENRSVPNPSTRTELKRPVHLHTLESDMQLGREREGSVYLDTHSAPRSGSGAMMRPDSSMTMMSDLTASTQGITVNYTADDDDARDHAYPRVHSKRGYADDVSIHSGRNSDELSHNFEAASPKRATVSATALAEEWGTSDPKLLAMIMKRNKRMKSFQQQKEAREREKSSSERYQKFLRSTANGKYGHSGNNGASGGGAKSGLAGTAVSGSFGGKPKSFRGSGGRGAGRGGRGGRVAMMPPAWMIGETESKDDA